MGQAELLAYVDHRHQLPSPPVRRALRVAAGLSQDQVADAVGVTAQAVSHWEAGERFPRARHLVAYVELLNQLKARMAAA